MGYDDRIAAGFARVDEAGPTVGVFASATHLAGLAGRFGPLPRILMRPAPLAITDPVPAGAVAGLAVAVVEVDPLLRPSIDRLVNLARQNPAVPVIAAVASADVSLVRTLLREGIADVIGLPLEADELTSAALEALARRAQVVQPAALAPLVCVARTSGGCGATTVATHLAHALAAREWGGREVVLGDLDLQFGSVAAYLNVDRGGSFADLIAARDRIDSFLLSSLTGGTSGGLAVVGAPEHIQPLDGVSADALLVVTEQLRRHYGLVVIDLPPGWTNWSASLAASANLVLLVADQSLSSIRRARRSLELLEQPGLAPERVEVVVNRAESGLFRPISTRTIEETLGCAVLAALPDAGEALTRAQDQGVLLEALSRRAPFTAAMGKLADSVEHILKGGA